MIIWKPVPGYEGTYEVSDGGDIRSLDRMVSCHSGRRLVRGQLIKSRPSLKGGYRLVTLSSASHSTTRTVHSIVMEAFVGPRPLGFQVAHEDDNGCNNALNNLSYKTCLDNHLDKVKHGRTARGSLINKSKLTEDQAVAIRYRRYEGESIVILAQEFGVSTTAISMICIGKNWKYAGGPRMESTR
jgi:hypothetical protein